MDGDRPQKRKPRLWIPSYLPSPESEPFRTARLWLGEHLTKLRGSRSPNAVAIRADTTSEQILAIEAGQLVLSLGELSTVVRRGYGKTLHALLYEYWANSALKNDKRDFVRKYYYSGRLPPKGMPSLRQRPKETPFFIGGGKHFVWATPFRHLAESGAAVDLIELAPYRKSDDTSGYTITKKHDGAEVLYVVYGEVKVHLDIPVPGYAPSELQPGQFIHFHSKYRHSIENTSYNKSALLFVVRTPLAKLRIPVDPAT